MTAVHVTRCPHCQTTFRVRDEHLRVAKGAVRCGSCLQIFTAADYFLTNASFSPASQAPSVKSRTGQTRKPPADQDEQLIHDDMEIDGTTGDSSTGDAPEKSAISSPDTQKRPRPRDDLQLDESIFDLNDTDYSHPGSIETGQDPSLTDSTSEEAWANALLVDEDIDNISVENIKLEDAKHFEEVPEEASTGQLLAEADELAELYDNTGEPAELSPDSPAQHNNDKQDQRKDAISDLLEEPLELTTRPPSGIAWGWGLASLLMLLLAITQTAYFKFDRLARSPQWRPYYGLVCQALGCQLPDVQDLSQMSTRHLVVRSHPRLQKALMVDTLLQNNASHAQPFPDLNLVFKDLNGKLIASRRFMPDEYLAGELAGQTHMPGHTPVHIALEIIDPGPGAVSYSIQLLANQK